MSSNTSDVKQTLVEKKNCQGWRPKGNLEQLAYLRWWKTVRHSPCECETASWQHQTRSHNTKCPEDMRLQRTQHNETVFDLTVFTEVHTHLICRIKNMRFHDKMWREQKDGKNLLVVETHNILSGVVCVCWPQHFKWRLCLCNTGACVLSLPPGAP